MKITLPIPPRSTRWLAALTVGMIGLAFSQPAHAIPDTTDAIQWTLNTPGSQTSAAIGQYFDTTIVSATRSVSAGVMTLTLTYHTEYDNASTQARYADVFLRIPGGPGNAFTYGAALGYQPSSPRGSGGLAANLYGPLGFAFQTSVDIWNTASGSTYGGEFVDLDNSHQRSPTRVTGGTDIGNVSVNLTGSNHSYDLTVTIQTSDATLINATGNSNPFDVFWGTADCANDPLLATLIFPNELIPTPEPASLTLLGVGLLGLGMTIRRRHRQT